MSKQFIRRSLCLLTAMVLTLPLMVSAVPAAQSGGTVVIRTVSDLLELAKDCTLDIWSQGKTVYWRNWTAAVPGQEEAEALELDFRFFRAYPVYWFC